MARGKDEMANACSVTSISWDRIHLTLMVALSVPPRTGSRQGTGDRPEVRFFLRDEPRSLPVKTDRVADGLYRLRLNVTDFSARKQVPDGTWRLVAQIDGQEGPTATYDLTDLERLDADSRVFLYDQNRAAYTVSFGITDSDERPEFLLRTYQLFRKSGSRTQATARSVVTKLGRQVVNRKNKVRAVNLVYRAARRLNPPQGNRILFASEVRPRLEGNLLRIRDRMVERGLDRSYEFSYCLRRSGTGSKLRTLDLVYQLARADYVLLDDYFGILESLNIAPQTKIIQVWHAGSGFKAIGFSRFGKYGSPKLQNAHRKYTYAITGSKHLVPVYAEAFGIEEAAVIPTGLPRIDSFLDPERTAAVVADFFRKYPQLEPKKIILFAPTFRGRGYRDAYYDYSRIDFRSLYEACGDDTVVLFRMHHFIRTPVPIAPEHADRFYDFTDFPDGNDLLHLTDLLITDYSSIIYEFALLNRPMLFFAWDQEVYSATRGFHRDYELTAPGKVCHTFDELVQAIRNHDYDTWKIEAFRLMNFDHIDTHSADRVIDGLILGESAEAPLRVEAPAAV
jgi:CDP-ribitol ribitolphosphotransferase / teichoic acid ribitol-phosphate polymerase